MRAADFALLGHQESWAQIFGMVAALRDPRHAPLAEEDVRQLVPFIPARAMLRLGVASTADGHFSRGVYVETFITPDDLEARAFHRAIEKVREAVACAAREGARIAALGGFTSIVLEGRSGIGRTPEGLTLTTGNTLTSAFIVKGVEKAALLLGIRLSDATLLVVGSTGDIGSACARYLGPKVRQLLLSARNPDRLRQQEKSFRQSGVHASASSDVRSQLHVADVVICAASMAAPALDLGDCRPAALICDAGYPKNLVPRRAGSNRPHVFWGGMGQCTGSWEADPLLDALYSFPTPRVAHGCLLEAVALALEDRIEPYSQGRGHITPERIEEMWQIANRHGISLSPLFGPEGLWSEIQREAAGGFCRPHRPCTPGPGLGS